MNEVDCNSATVLVVDDEDSLRLVTKMVLMRKGFNVLVAGSGEEALNILHTHEGSIDLLLTDVRMPGMHGGDLGIEFSRLFPSSKIIYMTAALPGDIAERFDCEFVMHKPFCLYELSDTISEMLSAGA